MPKLKLLPKHMLFLLAQRILLETWIESSAVSMPLIYQQIMLDEKIWFRKLILPHHVWHAEGE